MTRCGNDSKAWHYYNLALQCSPVKAAELKRECYEALSDICFKRGDFSQCIEYGVKGYTVKADKNEVRIHFVYCTQVIYMYQYMLLHIILVLLYMLGIFGL